MLTLPYVTTQAFKAHPTFLDVANLRSGDTLQADQDDELRNILLMASAWADNYCELGDNGTLAAHTRTENARLRVDRQGRLKYHPDHIPATAVTGLSYGYTPNSLTALTDFTNVWIEDSRQIVALMALAQGLGALQFGAPVYSSELYTQWTYTAGYANTTLTNSPAQGATQFTVANANGITPGGTLRIWEPGSEEAVTVASSYVAGSTTVPLTSALASAHTSGMGVSALPADVHLAVILYAVALLQRPDSEQEDVFPSTRVHPNSRVGGGHDGSGYVTEAERLLEPYRRVR